ncbi:MAG: ATP-binding protein [Bdellovibrionales bacterium]
MRTGIIVCEAPSGKVVYHNQEAENLIGHSIGEILSCSEFENYGGIHADGSKYRADEYPNAKVIMHGETVINQDLLYKVPSGKVVWLRASAIPIRDSSGIVRLAVCTFHDISNEKKFERELSEVNKELKRSNDELSVFASVAAHDIKSPLNTISGYLEIVRSELPGHVSDLCRSHLESISKSADRARYLVDQLLALSRAGGEKDIKFSKVDLNKVLTVARENLAQEIKASDGAIHAEPLPMVMGVEADLVRLFQNLICNSLKFRGNQKPTVHVSASSEDGWAKILYQDNGNGISKADLPLIFLPFKRAASSSGSGLGLSICSKIVERHGGQICVRSEIGVGTAFDFTLRIFNELPSDKADT